MSLGTSAVRLAGPNIYAQQILAIAIIKVSSSYSVMLCPYSRKRTFRRSSTSGYSLSSSVPKCSLNLCFAYSVPFALLITTCLPLHRIPSILPTDSRVILILEPSTSFISILCTSILFSNQNTKCRLLWMPCFRYCKPHSPIFSRSSNFFSPKLEMISWTASEDEQPWNLAGQKSSLTSLADSVPPPPLLDVALVSSLPPRRYNLRFRRFLNSVCCASDLSSYSSPCGRHCFLVTLLVTRTGLAGLGSPISIRPLCACRQGGRSWNQAAP